jgi:hypothetical protein
MRYKTGQEISFDGGRWAIIVDVDADGLYVQDEDGHEFEVGLNRID